MTKFKKTNTTRQKEVQVSNDNDPCQKDVDVVEAKLSKKDKRALNAYRAAEEIMTSEKTYVDVLKILDEFCRSVEETFPNVKVEGRIKFFSVIPTLLALNSHLLEEFEDRIKNWETRKKIADVLVAKAKFLKIYSEYIDNFQQSREFFIECAEKYPAFAKFLTEFEKRPVCQTQGMGVLGVQSHMIGPVQRVPRYKLLLEAYLKNQEEDSEDFEDSQKALKIVSGVADATNHSIIAQDMRHKMLKLANRVQNDFEFVRPGRELLKEERLVNLAVREVPQPWQVILVTDSLFFAHFKVLLGK